jgi:hypothetical protein
MLDYDQITKLTGKWDWGDNAQQKADFNKKMRRKLKLWLKEMPDMIKILNGLPPRVIENASLLDDLPKVIKFVEAFLEKADPLPVAEHESGEIMTFRNYAKCMETHPNVDDWKSHIKTINEKRYLIKSHNLTASPAEIRNCDILSQHIEHIQRYVDPSIIVIDDSEEWQKKWHQVRDAAATHAEMNRRADMMGRCGCTLQVIKKELPTKPPRKPRAMIDGKICDFKQPEAEPPN